MQVEMGIMRGNIRAVTGLKDVSSNSSTAIGANCSIIFFEAILGLGYKFSIIVIVDMRAERKENNCAFFLTKADARTVVLTDALNGHTYFVHLICFVLAYRRQNFLREPDGTQLEMTRQKIFELCQTAGVFMVFIEKLSKILLECWVLCEDHAPTNSSIVLPR